MCSCEYFLFLSRTKKEIPHVIYVWDFFSRVLVWNHGTKPMSSYLMGIRKEKTLTKHRVLSKSRCERLGSVGKHALETCFEPDLEERLSLFEIRTNARFELCAHHFGKRAVFFIVTKCIEHRIDDGLYQSFRRVLKLTTSKILAKLFFGVDTTSDFVLTTLHRKEIFWRTIQLICIRKNDFEPSVIIIIGMFIPAQVVKSQCDKVVDHGLHGLQEDHRVIVSHLRIIFSDEFHELGTHFQEIF